MTEPDKDTKPSTAFVDTFDIDKKLEVALKEYFHIEDQIDRFDDRSLKIKSWSITSSAVAISLGYLWGTKELFLIGSISALIFWYLEASWKYFQDALSPRISELENIIRDDINRYSGPAINQAFANQFKFSVELRRMPAIFTYRNVNLPHSLIVLAGLGLYLNEMGIFRQFFPQ